MQSTIEISMYALSDDYMQRVTDFILRVKQNKNIHVEVNGLSTQLFGDYEELMSVLKNEMIKDLQDKGAVFVLKIGPGLLTREQLPETLK